jgi:hypothetical protein
MVQIVTSDPARDMVKWGVKEDHVEGFYVTRPKTLLLVYHCGGTIWSAPS